MIDFLITALLFAYGLCLLLAILIPLWNRFFGLLFVLLMSSTASAAVSDAVVLVGDCSGVCVDPTGLVLTVKHCDLPPVVAVRFKDRTVNARRVYVCPETEGPVVFDCDGEGFPFVRLAQAIPPNGEQVWSAGYPAVAGRRELRWASGPILGGSQFQYRDGPFRGNIVRFSTSQGWSGGPLFNSQGEVCGLLNSSDGCTSVFVSYAATQEAYAACRNRPATKPTLYVFGSVHCGPCLKFKQHYADQAPLRQRLDTRYTIVFVDIDVHPGTADQFGIKEVPAFVVPGEPAIIGYTEPDVLLGQLGVVEEPATQATVPTPPLTRPVTEPVRETEQTPAPLPAQTVAVEKPTPVEPGVPPAAGEPDRSVADRLDRLSGLVQAGVSIATWLGVGGITGGTGGLVLGGLALWRTLRRRREARSPRDSPAAQSSSPPVVTVESPPPPQAIVPETRFAPYERDTFAEAFAWAEAEMVRKYPGAVSTLEAMKGLINQFLSAKGVKPKS